FARERVFFLGRGAVLSVSGSSFVFFSFLFRPSAFSAFAALLTAFPAPFIFFLASGGTKSSNFNSTSGMILAAGRRILRVGAREL
ncbi:hypothetical protein B0H14DRAFT_2908425, partial [Mycena olivaceomarginata]